MSWTFDWAPYMMASGNPEALIRLASRAGLDMRSRNKQRPHPSTNSEAGEVVAFWRGAGQQQWFAKDDNFDCCFRERFLRLHEAAARGDLRDWLGSPTGALALVILLDQYPRNSFRGSPRMYATDATARDVAAASIKAGHDGAFEPDLQLFFYLPFGHSEHLEDQEKCVALSRRLGEPNVSHAKRHRDIVRRFGRFPHRNPILGREMTKGEQRFLDEGGYSG